MLDLNKEMNNIIVKYGIDRQNKRFGEYVRAVELLNQLVLEHESVLFVVSHPMTAHTMRYDLRGGDARFAIVNVFDEESYADVCAGQAAAVIASYCFMGEMSVILGRKGIKHICLYDYFLRHGLALAHDYSDVFGYGYIEFGDGRKHDFSLYSPYLGIVYDRSRAAGLAKDDVLAKVFRERAIFALLYFRDFVTAKKYSDEYLSLYTEDTVDYGAAWVEIEGLLGQLRTELGKRGHKDIIVFFFDSIEYGGETGMPFLEALSGRSLVFENAYTVTPFTRPTVRAMFLGKRTIEERSFEIETITRENSPLIDSLYARGFDCRVYGNVGEKFAEEFQGNDAKLAGFPVAMIYWNALADLVNSPKPRLVLMHEVFETHNPAWNPELSDYLFAGAYDTNPTAADVNASKGYADRQLAFYASFLPDTAAKIYMSDHGRTIWGRHHTVLKVQGQGIPQATETRLFSYLDFRKLIDYIISPTDAKYGGLFRERAQIQDLDYYYGPVIKRVIDRKKHLDNIIGYQGTVTETDYYVRYNHGLEYYYKNQNDGILFSPERLEYLRSINGTARVDVEKEEVLRHSRYIYKVLDRYSQRNHAYEEKKTAVLKKLFADTGGGGISLYPGGMATYRLLLRVGLELCANVRYIIDINPQCLAGKLGIEVADPDRLGEYDIGTVIATGAPTARNLLTIEDIGNMLAGAKSRIIGIYEYLADNGINCHDPFWDMELADEDIDVDFPPVGVLG